MFISKQLLKHFRNNLLFKYNLCPIFGPTYIFVPFRLYHYQKCLSVINNFHWKAKRTILRRTFLYVNGMDFNMCGVIEEIKIHHLLKSGRLQRKIKQPTVGGQKPKFSEDVNSKSITRDVQNSVTLICPAQSFPTPSFR